MRILLCGINYAPDLIGVAKYNVELCEGLTALGHEVRVVTAPPYYPAWEVPAPYRGLRYSTESINDVVVRRAPIYVPKKPSGLKRLLHHASFALTSSVPLFNATRQWLPDVVFAVAPSLMSTALAAKLARRYDAASWLHIQDFEVDAAFELGLLSNAQLRNAMFAVERSILKSFDRISTISPQMVRGLERKGVPAERIRELRNWIDISQIVPGDRMTALRAELGYGASDVIALYSGNMSAKQGLELIIDAARELKDEPNLRFIMCGEGPQKAALREMAADLINVRFLDLQPNDRFAQLLITADIHIIAQRAEAADLVLPSKLGGILASGRPVVAMAAPGTGLANEVESAGIAVPPGDAHAFAQALRKIAVDEAARNSLGNNARQRAEERWNRTAIIKKLASELAEAAASAGRST